MVDELQVESINNSKGALSPQTDRNVNYHKLRLTSVVNLRNTKRSSVEAYQILTLGMAFTSKSCPIYK